jgi:hypothetical protein
MKTQTTYSTLNGTYQSSCKRNWLRLRLRLLAMVMATALFVAAPGFTPPAHALGGLIHSKFSDALKKLCDKGHPLACAWWAVLDPPGKISSVGFEMHYDPTKIKIDVADSGFLCDFSVGGSCPANDPGTITQLSAPLVVGGPRSGTGYTLTVGSNTVTLTYDLSGNPALAGSDRDFFALAFTTLQPEGSAQFDYQTNVGDMYQMNTTCTLTDGQQCGSDNPTPGFSFTPEPSSLLLMGSGVLGLSGFLRKRLFMGR